MDNKTIEIFSAEERDDITRHIERVSAREAVDVPGIPPKEDVLKHGVFPLFVNAGAMIILVAGILLLFIFQQTEAAEIQTSGAALGVTERALIREIRSETNSQLNEKDAAIDAMIRHIAEIDRDLEKFNSFETLTVEQRKAIEELRARHTEYRDTLIRLQQEKRQLLIQARISEEEVRQREKIFLERQGFLEDISGQNRETLEQARIEFSRLAGESQKTSDIAFAGIQSKEDPVLTGEETEESFRRQIDSQALSIAGQNAVIAELQKNMAIMQQQNDATVQTITERDRQLENLRAQNTSQAQQIESLQRTISSISSALQGSQ